MKTNLLHRLKRNASAAKARSKPKSQPTILLVVAVVLAFGAPFATRLAYAIPSPTYAAGRIWELREQGFDFAQIGGHDISGRWYHDGKPTSISVSSGGSVTITDEHGKSSGGHLSGKELVMFWLGIRGSVTDGGRRISWSNGTTWTREPQSHGRGSDRDLNGRWFHDGKPTTISVSSNGRDVTITDEQGHPSSGYMSGNEIVIKSFYGFGGEIRGRISHGGQRISWSNSTEWRR